jgi:hypothetical protein
MKSLFVLLLLSFPVLAYAETNNSLSYFCSAGKGELGTGIKILSDGRIFKIIKSKDMPNTIELEVGVDSNATAKIFSLTESNGFFESSYNHGKCSVTYHSPEKNHFVRYGAKAPKPIKEVFEQLQNLHRSAAEKKI